MKRSLIFFFITICLLALVILRQRPHQLPQADAQLGAFFPKYDAHKVARIEISQLLEGVQLEKKDEAWQVAPLVNKLKQELLEKEKKPMPKITWQTADSSRVKGVLGIFGSLEKGILVSQNPEKQQLYMLGAQGLQVSLFDQAGKTLGSIIIGKNGPDLASNYVRLTDTNDVYLVNESLLGIFSIEASDWKLSSAASESGTSSIAAPQAEAKNPTAKAATH